MFLKTYYQIYIITLFLIIYVKGFPIPEEILHPSHGSSYQNINLIQTISQPILASQFKNTSPSIYSSPQHSIHKQETTGEISQSSNKEISPDTYNLDKTITKFSNFEDKPINLVNKFKTENLYTLALPKMNFGRPKQYYVVRDKDGNLLNNNNNHHYHQHQQPHRFSNAAIKIQSNSNIEDLSDIQHHEELKNLADSYPELFESTPFKHSIVQPSSLGKIEFLKSSFPSTTTNNRGGDGGKLFKKEVKNKYLLASDVSHVKFNGMGVTYEF